MTDLGVTADIAAGWTMEQYRKHLIGQMVDGGLSVRMARLMVESFESRVRYEESLRLNPPAPVLQARPVVAIAPGAEPAQADQEWERDLIENTSTE